MSKTSEHFGPDPYLDREEEMGVNDAAERFQKALEPESYYQRFGGAYQLSRFFTASFPLLSATTLLVCVFFIATSGNYRAFFSGEMAPLSYFLVSLAMVGLGLVVFVVEKVKTTSLRTVFKASAKNRKAPQSSIVAAFVACLISIAGSAWGIFSLTYALTDQSHHIEQTATATVSGANRAFSGDSLRIVQQYQPLIQEKRNAVRNWDPKRYRTRRNKLNNEAAQLTKEMEGKIEQARSAADGRATSALSLRDESLTKNEHKSTDAAWIAFLTLVLLEIANVGTTRWNWIFRVKCAVEGPEAEPATSPAPSSASAGYAITRQEQGNHASGFSPIGFKRTASTLVTDSSRDRDESVTNIIEADGYGCTCTNCGTEYVRHRKPNPGERTFCSAKCRKQHQRKRESGDSSA